MLLSHLNDCIDHIGLRIHTCILHDVYTGFSFFGITFLFYRPVWVLICIANRYDYFVFERPDRSCLSEVATGPTKSLTTSSACVAFFVVVVCCTQPLVSHWMVEQASLFGVTCYTHYHVTFYFYRQVTKTQLASQIKPQSVLRKSVGYKEVTANWQTENGRLGQVRLVVLDW